MPPRRPPTSSSRRCLRTSASVVETFGDDVTVLTPPTTDRGLLTAQINGIVADGDTALYDVVVTASQHFTPAAEHKVLVLLSDGKDDGSTATLDDAIAAVQGVHVEAISLTTAETDINSLSALGTVTSADDAAGISAAFARVANLLTHVVEPSRCPRRPRTVAAPTTRRGAHHAAAPTTTATTTVAAARRPPSTPARRLRPAAAPRSLVVVRHAVAGRARHLRRPVRARAAALPPGAGLEGSAGHRQAAQRVRHGPAHDVGRRGGPRAAWQTRRAGHRLVGRRHLHAARPSSSPWSRSSPSSPGSSAC